jgi:superfamily II DNA/RNA helicase
VHSIFSPIFTETSLDFDGRPPDISNISTFSDVGITGHLVEHLEENMGIQTPTPVQMGAIPPFLQVGERVCEREKEKEIACQRNSTEKEE